MSTVAFDTETRGLAWYAGETAFLVSWTDEQGSHVEPTEDGAPRFRAAVDKADTLVAHNLSFDVHQVRESLGLDLLNAGKELIDTDLLARVALPERRFADQSDDADSGRSGYKLKNLAKTYLRADAQAAEDKISELAKSSGFKLKEAGGYYDVWRAYPEAMEDYALLDAEYARDLLPILEAKLTPNMRQAWALERSVTPALIRAEQRGVATDQEVVEQLHSEYQPMAEEAGARVTAALGEEALSGADAMREALLSHGVPLYQTTKTGQLMTNKFALQEFADDFPVIADLFEWRAAEKFLSTYILPLRGWAIVHPSFFQLGAWTSRMSCSNPNMQNIPVRSERGDTPVRACFVPRTGYCFVVVDLDSIELRLLAYYLNRPEFKKLIADGYDAFAWLAAELDGGVMEDYVKGSPGEKRRGDYKNVTYAICYGAGGKRITDMLNLDPAPWYDEDHPKVQAARARGRDWPKPGYQYAAGREVANKVKATLPGYQDLAGYKGRVRKKIEACGFVTTLYGHKQVISKDKAYIGLNALIQGSAAGIFKAGIVATEEAVKHLGAMPVLFVHDEIVVECPIEHADECLVLTKASLVNAYPLDPKLAATGTIARGSYADAK